MDRPRAEAFDSQEPDGQKGKMSLERNTRISKPGGVCLSPMGRGGSSAAQMENGDGYGRMPGWAIHASRQSSSQNPPGVNTMKCRLAINPGSQKLISANQKPVRPGIETSGTKPHQIRSILQFSSDASWTSPHQKSFNRSIDN